MVQLHYADVSKRLGKIKPETKSIAEEIFEAAKAAGHEIWYMWGQGTSADHKTGLALDLMVRNEKAGDFVRDYIWKHRKRLRLKHVIWEQHITSTVVEPGKRRKMKDRHSPTANHMDHPHVLFFPGKYQPLVQKKPAEVINSVKSSDDKILLVENGNLDAATIRRWQEVMGTPVDGKISKKSTLVYKVQKRLKSTVDHRLVVDGDGESLDFGVERKTVEALQRYLGVRITRRLSSSKSDTVRALQRRLNAGRF